jgi:hypothetical protein
VIWSLVDARQTVIHRDGGVCVACGQRFEEIHHRFRRGMGGSKHPDIHSPANLLSLCGSHHRQAESLRTDVSAVNGWCVPTLAASFLTPVLTIAGWFVLNDRGTVAWIGSTHAFPHAEAARSAAHFQGLLPA